MKGHALVHCEKIIVLSVLFDSSAAFSRSSNMAFILVETRNLLASDACQSETQRHNGDSHFLEANQLALFAVFE